MSDQLTIKLNGSEYALTKSFKENVETRAKNEFKENPLFDCWWSENKRGDPILNIETEGYWVPWDRLESLEFEMQEVEQDEPDDSDDTEEIDAGNGMKTVPKDDVDMDTDPTQGPDDEDEEEPDTTFMMTHPTKHYVPQPDEDDPEKLPPDPEELPEDPSLIAWIPDDNREEVWTTGKALVPSMQFVQWNVQIRADEAPDGATKLTVGDSGHVDEEVRTNSHDHWESLAELHDCEKVGEVGPSDEPSEPGEYAGKEPEDRLNGTAGGNNWSFGNR